MSDDAGMHEARRTIAFANERGTSLAEPFVGVFPVSGAAVSVLSVQMGQATVASTDATATRLDELQFDLGEGPCWQALESRAPVVEANLRTARETIWPHFLDALRSDRLGRDVGAMYAFPLMIGTLEIGAVDLWSANPGELNPRAISDATSLADLTAWQVLRRVIGSIPQLTTETDSISSRREIHQATGMVLVQLGISADDAALLLRAHAFATGRSLSAVASDVVGRRLDFSDGHSPGNTTTGRE